MVGKKKSDITNTFLIANHLVQEMIHRIVRQFVRKIVLVDIDIPLDPKCNWGSSKAPSSIQRVITCLYALITLLQGL
jgi:hypothetical protein